MEQSSSASEAQLKPSFHRESVAKVDDNHIRTRLRPVKATFIAILPLDLKLEIFLHATSHDVIPLILGAVCKEWRDIVWNFPRFWDTINLVLSKGHYKRQMILLKDWLERSGKFPLSITLRCTKAMLRSKVSKRTCLSLLFAQSHRWENIDFTFPRKDIVEMIREPGHLPLLRSLSLFFICLDDRMIDASNGLRLYYFSTAPLLRSATFTGEDLIDIIVSWEQLEHLNVFSYNNYYFFTTLEQAYSLKYSSPASLSTTSSNIYRNRRIPLPNLQSLTIYNYQTLRNMDFPSLTSLYIGSEHSTIDINVLVDLVKRSCHITTLHIMAANLTRDSDLMASMRELPSLLELFISLENTRGGLSHCFIEALRPDCDTPLLPNLETLTYTGWTSLHYTPLIDAVEQRWMKRSEEGQGLGSVRIYSKNAIQGMDDQVAREIFQKLHDEGMDIVVSSGNKLP